MKMTKVYFCINFLQMYSFIIYYSNFDKDHNIYYSQLSEGLIPNFWSLSEFEQLIFSIIKFNFVFIKICQLTLIHCMYLYRNPVSCIAPDDIECAARSNLVTKDVGWTCPIENCCHKAVNLYASISMSMCELCELSTVVIAESCRTASCLAPNIIMMCIIYL